VLANGLFAAGPIIETDAPVVNSYAGSGRRGQGAVSVREPASGEVFRLGATDIEATLTRSGHTRRLKFRRGALGWLYQVRR